MSDPIDIISQNVLWNRLVSVCEEQANALMRAAFGAGMLRAKWVELGTLARRRRFARMLGERGLHAFMVGAGWRPAGTSYQDANNRASAFLLVDFRTFSKMLSSWFSFSSHSLSSFISFMLSAA